MLDSIDPIENNIRDYYRILGLERDASLREIKTSYRRLAMRYHPDRNSDPRAEEAFILINEAYEFLNNPTRRQSYSRPLTGRERDDARRRKVYEEWKKNEQRSAQQRAFSHAHSSYQNFEKSPIFKAAMVLDKVYNCVFIIIGLMMIVMPLLGVSFLPKEIKSEYNYFTLIIPVVLGIAFIYGIWYFIFQEVEE